ncbi:unnamed protein product [Pleuronectes platessa]|uniref:Uncharacterized protein n=1 Tax=Pleuronectes platessa TaxID=8262 RepID=A0A9N7YTR1_PLEPL|nr:unnamed protein product [Pleuronectes platessa]
MRVHAFSSTNTTVDSCPQGPQPGVNKAHFYECPHAFPCIKVMASVLLAGGNKRGVIRSNENPLYSLRSFFTHKQQMVWWRSENGGRGPGGEEKPDSKRVGERTKPTHEISDKSLVRDKDGVSPDQHPCQEEEKCRTRKMRDGEGETERERGRMRLVQGVLAHTGVISLRDLTFKLRRRLPKSHSS